MLVTGLTLFTTALLAATLLPLSSELLLVAELLRHPHAWWWLWLLALAGNCLGSAINWYLGYYLLHFRERRWFPFREADLGRAQAQFQRYGSWSLLLAWVPLIGDALTFVAGVMKVNFWRFLLLVMCGKAARYGAVVYFTLQQVQAD